MSKTKITLEIAFKIGETVYFTIDYENTPYIVLGYAYDGKNTNYIIANEQGEKEVYEIQLRNYRDYGNNLN